MGKRKKDTRTGELNLGDEERAQSTVSLTLNQALLKYLPPADRGKFTAELTMRCFIISLLINKATLVANRVFIYCHERSIEFPTINQGFFHN